MSKTITFSYKGKDYTLEFDRKQVERMERSGFSIQNFDNATITSTYQLFNGAFQKHHRNIKSELTEEMPSPEIALTLAISAMPSQGMPTA